MINDAQSLSSSSSSSTSLSKWNVILLGQAVSLSLAFCSAASSTLQDMRGAQHMPLFQISLAYFFLGFHMFSLMRIRKVGKELRTESIQESDDDDCEDQTQNHNCAMEQTPLLGKQTHLQSEQFTAAIKRNDLMDSETLNLWPFQCLSFQKLHSPWYFYALIAFLDVQANYVVILSFRYTSLINSNILTSLGVISVMVTSYFFLKRRFRIHHYIGSCFCILGASMILSSDAIQSSLISPLGVVVDEDVGNLDLITSPAATVDDYEANQSTKWHIWGDIMAIVSAMLFGLNDTLAELSIQNSTGTEYLAMMGVFGFIFSCCESWLLEHDEIMYFISLLKRRFFGSTMGMDDVEVDIDLAAILYVWVWYIICFWFFYTLASYFLSQSNATLMNLSLLSVNFYTVLFSIVVKGLIPTPLFIVSAMVIILGVWLYERGLGVLEIYYSCILDCCEGGEASGMRAHSGIKHRSPKYDVEEDTPNIQSCEQQQIIR